MPNLVKNESNTKSKRIVTIEETDFCAWLYLSMPNSMAIEKDVWLYNKIKAPKSSGIEKYQGQAPPAPRNFIYEPGTFGKVKDQNIEFRWSEDGEAVALWIFAELHAFIVPEQKHGYSRLPKQKCPWGNPIDFDAYDRHLKS